MSSYKRGIFGDQLAHRDNAMGMWPPTRQEERAVTGPSLTSLRRNQHYGHLDFWLLSSRIFLLFKLPVLWYFFMVVLVNKHTRCKHILFKV